MFSHDVFTTVFGAVPAGDLEALAGVIRAALREGFAIVLNEPGTKKPLCPLNAAQAKAADRALFDQDMEHGRANPRTRHLCGVHHALIQGEEGRVTTLLKRVEKRFGGLPNIGVEPGRSRLLVVDVDTAAERDAFLASWREEADEDAPEGYTVISPGAQRPDGSWAHEHGGHYWFTLPDGLELPTLAEAGGVLKDASGWTMVWAERQVLVPPSVRPEGPYRLVGAPTRAAPWLTDRVFRHAEGRAERERIRLEAQRAKRESGEIDPVDAWAADTAWGDLLEPDGWTATGLVDTCSCPTWTAPGPHGSPKSATAHDVGCTYYDSDEGHAPLHVWTDNPPDYLVPAVTQGQRTLTKLTYMALRDHHGSESLAVSALGLAVNPDGERAGAPDPFVLNGHGPGPVQSLTSTADFVEPGPVPEPTLPASNETEATPEETPRDQGEQHRGGAEGGSQETPPELSADDAKALLAVRANYGPDVAKEVYRLDVRDQAATVRRSRQLEELGEPTSFGLEDFLGQEFEGPSWLMEGLWPAEGRVVLVAQYKAGKSTLVGNALRALVDGGPFLGVPGTDVFSSPSAGATPFPVVPWPAEASAMLVDLELAPRVLQGWLRDQGIQNTKAVRVQTLRGAAAQFQITDDRRRDQWARYLQDQGTRVLFLDPLAPLLAACGIEEDDNTGMGAFTQAVDELATTAGVQEVLVVHHMGHNGERVRGASRLRDWPDATWTLVREGQPGEEPPVNAARFFRALGRDVEVPETKLAYDHETRRLTLEGGTRRDHLDGKYATKVIAFVSEHPGAGAEAIDTGVRGMDRTMVPKVRRELVDRGLLTVRLEGPRKRQAHYLPGDVPDPPSPGQEG